MSRYSNVRVLAECAICVAVAVVLSLFTIFKMPMGGSVTPFATLPVIVIGLRHGLKWGVASALVFSLTQLLLGISSVAAVPVKTFGNLVLCAALDYVLAYTFIGLTGAIARLFRSRWVGIPVGIVATGIGRLACSFISGILIWGVYAPDDWSVAFYSFAYNATWCLPDVAIVLAACLVLARIPALGILPAKKAIA